MTEFKKIATTSDIPTGQVKSFEVGLDNILICNTGKGYFAVLDMCTHARVPLSNGQFHGQEIICSRHGARFDVTTGDVKSPPAVVPLDTYELKVDGNDILVKIE